MVQFPVVTKYYLFFTAAPPFIQSPLMGSWYGERVRGTGYGIRGTGYRVRSTWYGIRDTWHVVLGTGYRVRGSGYGVRGSGKGDVGSHRKDEIGVRTITNLHLVLEL